MSRRIPKVRIARPAARPYQLRYTDPDTGKEVRISTGSRDEQDAEEQKQKLEAKLLLGIDTKPERPKVRGPGMRWQDFREEYRDRPEAAQARKKTFVSAESRLSIAERILKPKTLADVARKDALTRLQAELLAGAEGRTEKPVPRSPHTVKSMMASVLAALRWAAEMEWLESVPKIRPVKVSKLRKAKGRAIATEEFERMLKATTKVVGVDAAESWKHVLRGLWTSALRLDELMHVSWDDEACIVPEWPRRGNPVLHIPADRQKNATEESIPLLPEFDALLTATPEDQRTGWVFNPMSIQGAVGRKPGHARPSAEWVGKIVSRIGKRAGVVVSPAKNGKPAKFASAHDLRRSCGDRLMNANVPQDVIQRIMRHASWETTRRFYAAGNVQNDANRLREALQPATDVPRYVEQVN